MKVAANLILATFLGSTSAIRLNTENNLSNTSSAATYETVSPGVYFKFDPQIQPVLADLPVASYLADNSTKLNNEV